MEASLHGPSMEFPRLSSRLLAFPWSSPGCCSLESETANEKSLLIDLSPTPSHSAFQVDKSFLQMELGYIVKCFVNMETGLIMSVWPVSAC